MVIKKRCPHCKKEKGLRCFNREKRRKDGRALYCRVCTKILKKTKYAAQTRETGRKYRERKGEEIALWQKEHRANNREHYKKLDADNYQRNKEQRKAYKYKNRDRDNASKREYSQTDHAKEVKRKYSKAHPWIQQENTTRYHASKLKATPAYLTKEDRAEMREIYKERLRLSEETGIPHHVDHVWPLQGDIVKGLHVPQNLKVVPATDNLRKHNKLTPELEEKYVAIMLSIAMRYRDKQGSRKVK